MEVTFEKATTTDVKGFDVNKLIEQFGSSKINKELLERILKVCKLKDINEIHPFLRRNIVFSHRDFDLILDDIEKGKEVYLYTGRGPSSDSMHLGHYVPFMFTKYLQDLFKCKLFIQISDDEKFLIKGEYTQEEYYKMAINNIKDIIACGFNPKTTYIFINTDILKYGTIPKFYENTLKIMQKINYNQIKSSFGLTNSDNIGKSLYPIIQMVPALGSTFFKDKEKPRCLIPCAIDQDPYFRLVRDVLPKLKEKKCSLIHSTFLPSLAGNTEKMSSSETNKKNTIFLKDSLKSISKKINKSFSGGQETVELHREKGGVPDVDISFKYLTFFLDDDKKLQNLKEEYSKGNILSGELKKICFETIQPIILNHQENVKKITSDLIQEFLDMSK